MIYDISQPVFECCVFPGDSSPIKKQVMKIENGDICNLTEFSMCAHNGTHIDAPRHFLSDGKPVDKIDLNKFMGPALIYGHNGEIGKEEAEKILHTADASGLKDNLKILIKGKAVLNEAGAKIFAEAKLDLFGNESQTVGPENAPMNVHLIMLKAEIILLEGIRLSRVPEGIHTLNCCPLNLTETDGSPCRAVLTD